MKLSAPSVLLISLFCCFLFGIVGFSNLGAAAPANLAADESSDLAISTGVQKTILDNGLTVITKEIHTAPVVSVQVWYRVGARNEIAGQNGISHQLEHLMFKGTASRPIQFGRFFSALGSQFNAFTSYDETAYFNTVESDKLDAVLLLEADRMVNTVIDSPKLQSEQRVVISELQGYENSPDYRLSRAVMQAALPNHPYGFPVGGTKADVEKFTVEAVKAHYQKYYRPSNATLVITGDFETESLLPKVRASFGSLAQQEKPSEPLHPPLAKPQNAQPISLTEPGSSPLLTAVYPLPAISHPDVPAIDLMDAILTGGRSARLYQALVESGLSSGVGSYASELIDLGWYEVSADAAPGQEIAQVDRVLQQAIETLRQTGVSEAELERAKTQLKTSVIFSNQDIASQASQLAYSELVARDYRYSDRYLAAIERVSVSDIQRVAQTYLDPAQRTVGFFQPTQPDAQTGTQTGADPSGGRTVENFSPGQPVDPAEIARYLPTLSDATHVSSQALPSVLRLNNGITVLLLPDDSTPTVTLNGWIEAGSAFDSPDKAGLASLTADNLMNGTAQKTALELATQLEDRGVSLGFGASREGVAFSGDGLDSELPLLLQTLAEVLQQASFPTDQLELTRQQELSSLQAIADDPGSLAVELFQQQVYPDSHPYHHFPTAASLKAITQADVVDFYQSHYQPKSTVISLVGRFEPAAAEALLNRELGAWQPKGQAAPLQFPKVQPQPARLKRSLPGKAQAVTYLGYYGGLNSTDPRLYAARVMNQILGGDTLSSRLGTEIRDRLGLTYGISSYLQTGRQPGAFIIEMQTAPEDTQNAIDSTIALLKQVQADGFTPAEIAAAQRAITSSYAVGLASLSSVGASILSNQVYGFGPEEIREFPQRIEAVTPEQVQQAIQDLIRPEDLIIVTVGP